MFEGLSAYVWNLMKLNCHVTDLTTESNALLRESCVEMQMSYDQAVNYLTIIAHSLAIFKDREISLAYLMRRTLLGTTVKHEVLHSPLCLHQSTAQLLCSELSEGSGPLLPFDSLINDVSLAHRYHIARAASSQLLSTLPLTHSTHTTHHTSDISGTSVTHNDRNITVRSDRNIKIGFITCDFNNHPTAHLVEGIFAVVRKLRAGSEHVSRNKGIFSGVELIAFSYGPSDNSTYRQNIMALADKFIDLASVSNADASAIIRQESVDILLDMQLHTLGHRLLITAAQPAPLQINYLVYPGTSGASFLQYLLTDRTVTPAEHSVFYSESLLMLPSTYQVSFYDRYLQHYEATKVNSDRHSAHTPGVHTNNGRRVMTLCNFNKIDKFDMDSFAVWAQVMNRFPESVFKLVMDTRPEVVHNIHSEFAFRGVHTRRVGFLARVKKEEHIRRHMEMDLFVDSMVYGAHSTATDALMGALPVLTLCGDTFPQRVGSSLLASLSESSVRVHSDATIRSDTNPSVKRHDYGQEASEGVREDKDFSLLSKVLQTFSKKSFEDVAIRLLQSPDMLLQLRTLLMHASHTHTHTRAVVVVVVVVVMCMMGVREGVTGRGSLTPRLW